MLPQDKREKKRMESNDEDEGGSSECVSHGISLLCVDSLHGLEGVKIH